MIQILKDFYAKIKLYLKAPFLLKVNLELLEEKECLVDQIEKLQEKLKKAEARRIFLEEKFEIIQRQTTDPALELHKVLNIQNVPGPLWITFADERMLNDRAFQMIKHTIENSYPLVGPIIISPPLEVNTVTKERLVELGMSKFLDDYDK